MNNHKSIFNRLTKKELVHLVEKGDGSEALSDFQKLRKEQIEMKEQSSSKVETCWDCRFIAKKLGIED